ncbi:MAG: TadE/TadG family type IV pilus assembly protein [Kineosporiaceae bacterium]
MTDTREPGRSRPHDTGSMAVELVLLAPLLVAFLMLVAAFARYVAVEGEVEAAAREAARAASLERSAPAAAGAARTAAAATLPPGADCTAPVMGGSFTEGGVVTVALVCRVDLSDLGLLGLPGSVAVDATSAAPLETYRRVG